MIYRDILIEKLLRIKEIVSSASDYAVKYNLFPDNPTKVLDLSCMCDDLIGELKEKV